MNPYIIEMMLRERREEMLSHAAHLRLLAALKPKKESTRVQLLAALGRILVRAGESLQLPYDKRYGQQAGLSRRSKISNPFLCHERHKGR